MAFPVTQWTLLAKATLSGDVSGRDAFDLLCRTYWRPVFDFCRASGWRHEDAEDLTQRFFLYLMERSLVQQADRQHGTFRAFLKTVLRRFLSDEITYRNAQKRGKGAQHLPIEFAETSPLEDATSEHQFDRNWAQAALNSSLAKVMSEFCQRRSPNFAPFIRPFLGGDGELLSYPEAAEKMQLSLTAFKSEIHSLRRRLREQLRIEVRQTVSSPHEFEQEFSYLRKLLSE